MLAHRHRKFAAVSTVGFSIRFPPEGEPPDATNPDVLKVNGMVEKPVEKPRVARRRITRRPAGTCWARRSSTPFDKGVGGEIQLTDAIALLISEGHPVHVVVHRGAQHELGDPGGYLKAAVDLAQDRDDYGPELRNWLQDGLQ